MMEMAKVTSKGQITIPISIRRRLGINEGDKILFVHKQDGVLMLNPDTVQGDVADYAADAVSVETPVTPASPKAAAKPAASKISDNSASAPAIESLEPEKRKPIPPADKPAAAAGGTDGINLSTILDDIRSIGSNI